MANKSKWARLIPIAFITYSLAYLDRVNYGFGAAAGMAEDLHITGAVSSLLGSLFFLGYFIFQVPGAHYAEKRSAKKLIFWSLILWGALASSLGLVTNIKWLLVTRFFLGVVESVVMPTMLVFLSHWFTKKERSKANTFLILGNPVTVMWGSVVSGYLINAMSWRWMFIIEGLPSIIWAFFWLKLVDDRPKDAKWLTEQEKDQLNTALEQEQTDIEPVKNYREALKSGKVILLTLQYFFWSIGLYGFILWLPSMIKSASSTGIVETGWLSAVPYLLAAILMILCSYFSDRTLNRKIYVWPFMLIGAITFFTSYMLKSDFWVSYIFLIIAGGSMYASYGPFFAFVTEVMPRNVAGVAMAFINSMGQLGSFIGSYFVGYLNSTTGGPGASYIFMASCLLLSSIFMALVKVPNSKKKVKTTQDIA